MVPILLAQPVGPAERAHRVRRGLGPGVPADLMTTFTERTGVSLVDGYGSTETNFVIGETAAGRKHGAMGRIRPGFEALVVDEYDNPMAAGVPGELVLRAAEPFAFASGYLGMADKTVEAWRNLWFHTGDRVARDEDGWFRFIDRLKDVIRRRGENISSHEVEQVLLSHPDVEAAAAFPVASDLAEDEVMVALVVRQGQTLDPVALMRFCEPRMPYFAMPRYVEVLADLPRTENGKIQKFRLRERGVTAATWDREAAGYAVRRL
jgi:crotonobetaine/carnitine-CoA ligase